jgi:predicted nucleotidyltransferase component of viral defense system
MPLEPAYRRQVALLVRILPLVAEEKAFALKGGTAINLFIRDMPRLSIDIDLTYVPVESRDASLKAIDAAIKRIAERIKRTIGSATVTESRIEDTTTRLGIRADNAQIKIEVTPVLRGCVYEPELRRVAASVEDAFGFAEMQLVSFADLYAGKIVAALDRQHPRDLFDIRDLLRHEGIDDALRRAFLVYLISHDRPMHEVLKPVRKPLAEEFARGFAGMTEEPVAVVELEAAREALIEAIVKKMPQEHRQFLISFEEGKPAWDLLGLPGIPELPAVKWRQLNLDRLAPDRRAELVSRLTETLRSQ